MNKLYFILLLFVASFTACKTATKAYDKGDYREAIELAAKRLQKDPTDGKTKSLALNAYQRAVAEREDNIRMLSKSTADNRYEQIYYEYNNLQSLYTTIRSNPALSNAVKATDYSDFVETYRNKSADVYAEKALAKMEEENKPAYQEAYRYFKKALDFKRGDIQLKRQADEAYNLAITKVVVLPVDDQYGGGYRYSNGYRIRNFEDQIIRNLQYLTNNNFVKFYSEWNARSQNIDADEFLEMRLGRLVIGQPYDQYNSRNVSKEVVVKETVYKPDSVVKQYAKVNAQITVVRRTMISEGDLYVTARDKSGRILWNDIFRGEHRWQVEFATFAGDERALSENDKSLINNRSTFYNTPREDEIMENVLRQIENDMHYRFRNYYARYY
jgi:tetratricopeptide (TPR) repeat protein